MLVAEGGEQEVHVFRGKVQAEEAPSREQGGGSNPNSRPPASRTVLLTAHEAIRVAAPGVGKSGRDGKADPAYRGRRQAVRPHRTVGANRRAARRVLLLAGVRRWKRFSQELCKRPDLIAYYDFQPDESNPRVLRTAPPRACNTTASLSGRRMG